MNRRILNLAIPNIISNVTVPLLGMVDLAITGHLDSNVYMGAIALGGMVFNLLYWTFGFLRMGTSGLTAQALGSRDLTQVHSTLVRGFLVGLMGAFLILVLQIPIEKLAFWLVDGSKEVEQYARSYFYIRVWAAPATISLYALTGWFIGMQNTKTPMAIAIIINVANIGFNLLFVRVFHMKSDGVALGTVLAQYLGLIIAIGFIKAKYYKIFKYRSRKAFFNALEIKHFFRVNRDILFRTLSLLAVFTFFTSKSASENNNILAANTLLLQFMFMFSFITDGLAYAAEALTGRFYGAGNIRALKKSIVLVFKWGGVLSLLFTLLYWMWHNQILRLLTDQAEVLSVSREYTFWVIIIPVVSVASFLWDGIFIGLTASKQMRNSMIIAAFVVFFPVWYLLYPYIGNHSLWLAFNLFLFTRGLAQTVMFKNISMERK